MSKEFDTYRQMLSEASNGVNSVTMDVPFLIRVMEACREDVEDDVELHKFAEQIIHAAAGTNVPLVMDDWDRVCTCSKKGEGQSGTD